MFVNLFIGRCREAPGLVFRDICHVFAGCLIVLVSAIAIGRLFVGLLFVVNVSSQ